MNNLKKDKKIIINRVKIKTNNTKELNDIEIKKTRYEHIFKFLWFFGAVFYLGLYLSETDNTSKPIFVFCTIGPMLMATGLLFIFVIVQYLVSENHSFVTNRILDKRHKKYIVDAEFLYLTFCYLTRIFLFLIIPIYVVFLSIGYFNNFNIYKYLTRDILIIVFIVGIFVFAIVVHCLKFIYLTRFKNKYKNTNLYINIFAYIYGFLFLFMLMLVAHGHTFNFST